MIKIKIEAEFLTAFKNRDIVRKNTLGIVKSKMTEWSKTNPGKEISNSDITSILSSEIKKRNQTIEMYAGQFNEQALENKARELKEIDILREFLPTQMTEAEIVAEIEKIKATNPSKLMPTVMQHFSKNFKGQYDNKILQSLIN